MPDPISPLSSSPPNTCTDDDGALSSSASPAAPTASAPPAPTAPTQSLNAPSEPAICAVPSLVAKFTPPAALPPPTTTVFDKSLGHRHTDSGPLQGSDRRFLSGRVKYGEDNDVQVTGPGATLLKSRDGYSLSLTMDSLTARGNLGVHNDDGSTGGNVGATAELAGAEVTLGTPAFSVTGGLSMSWGASGSLGIRDQDHDGKPEYCEKFSIPVLTEGVCVEKFW